VNLCGTFLLATVAGKKLSGSRASNLNPSPPIFFAPPPGCRIPSAPGDVDASQCQQMRLTSRAPDQAVRSSLGPYGLGAHVFPEATAGRRKQSACHVVCGGGSLAVRGPAGRGARLAARGLVRGQQGYVEKRGPPRRCRIPITFGRFSSFGGLTGQIFKIDSAREAVLWTGRRSTREGRGYGPGLSPAVKASAAPQLWGGTKPAVATVHARRPGARRGTGRRRE
jgi:hypothetical protein